MLNAVTNHVFHLLRLDPRLRKLVRLQTLKPPVLPGHLERVRRDFARVFARDVTRDVRVVGGSKGGSGRRKLVDNSGSEDRRRDAPPPRERG